MAVQDGPVWFLFDYAGDIYYGHRFKMLAALETNLKPDTFSHTFATLLSLVIDKQAEEGMHEFPACFWGHLHNMSRSSSESLPFFRPCSSYGHFILLTKQSLTCLLQNRRKSSLPQSILLYWMHNSCLSLVLMATLIPSQMIY